MHAYIYVYVHMQLMKAHGPVFKIAVPMIKSGIVICDPEIAAQVGTLY